MPTLKTKNNLKINHIKQTYLQNRNRLTERKESYGYQME